MQNNREYATTTVKPGYHKYLKQICCKVAEDEKAMTFKYDIDVCGEKQNKNEESKKFSFSHSHKAMPHNYCIQKHTKPVGCDMGWFGEGC